MKVVITKEWIEVTCGDDELNAHGGPERTGVDWTCRLASHEAVAWAMKRLGEELEKSVQFYRTGEPVDKISMN